MFTVVIVIHGFRIKHSVAYTTLYGIFFFVYDIYRYMFGRFKLIPRSLLPY